MDELLRGRGFDIADKLLLDLRSRWLLFSGSLL
jgi:hypothetical protein